jgi:hypothetical protein
MHHSTAPQECIRAMSFSQKIDTAATIIQKGYGNRNAMPYICTENEDHHIRHLLVANVSPWVAVTLEIGPSIFWNISNRWADRNLQYKLKEWQERIIDTCTETAGEPQTDEQHALFSGKLSCASWSKSMRNIATDYNASETRKKPSERWIYKFLTLTTLRVLRFSTSEIWLIMKSSAAVSELRQGQRVCHRYDLIDWNWRRLLSKHRNSFGCSQSYRSYVITQPGRTVTLPWMSHKSDEPEIGSGRVIVAIIQILNLVRGFSNEFEIYWERSKLVVLAEQHQCTQNIRYSAFQPDRPLLVESRSTEDGLLPNTSAQCGKPKLTLQSRGEALFVGERYNMPTQEDIMWL